MITPLFATASERSKHQSVLGANRFVVMKEQCIIALIPTLCKLCLYSYIRTGMLASAQKDTNGTLAMHDHVSALLQYIAVQSPLI